MITKILLGVLLSAGTLSAGATSAGEGGVLAKIEAVPGTYCHIKFLAIRENTLKQERPVLKDASSGDIIDYYGRCDHDPLGQDEIKSQKEQMRDGNEYRGNNIPRL